MFLNIELVSLLTLANLCLLDASSILSFWRDRDIRNAPQLCPQKWELLGAVRAGGPLRTTVHPNQTVVLQCQFCEDPEETEDDDDIGMWTYVDIVRGSSPVRVPRPNIDDTTKTHGSFLGFGRKSRIVLTVGQGLALRKTHTTDLGIYQCRRYNDKSSFGSIVRFLIDMDITLFEEQLKQEKEKAGGEDYEEDDYTEEENSSTEKISTVQDVDNNFIMETPHINGSSDDWKTYRKSHLDPLDKMVTRAKLHLEAISEWSQWTDCSQCWTTKYGVRNRRGVCVLRLPLHETDNDAVVVKELAGLPALSCRSAILYRLHPQVAHEARKVPDFIEYDYKGCNGVCAGNSSKSHGSLFHRLVYLFRHRRDTPLTTHRKMTIIAGETLVIVCPGATGETPVRWQKDGEFIGGGSSKSPIHRRSPAERMLSEVRKMEHWVSGQIVGIKDQPENMPFVDSAGVLRVTIAAPKNSGNYECAVNGTPRGSFQVEVIVKSTLSFDDLIRHFAYVSLVLLSGVMVWCGVVLCVTLRRRIQKHNYSVLPQTGGRNWPDRPPPPASNDHETSGSPSDTVKGHRDSDESALDPGGRPGKRAKKQKSAAHLPSRKLLRAAKADSPEPPSPLTASYHKVSSRLRDYRVGPFSRLISRHSSANDEIELVRLMAPRSSEHSTKYRPRTPSGRHCRPCSSTSSSSVEYDTLARKGPVTILSQQLFPASQKVLRPVPLPSERTRSPTRASKHLREATPVLEKPQRAPGSVEPPCSWSPSAISISVLRARNSLRQDATASPLSNTSKLARTVHMDQLSFKTQQSKIAGTSKELNICTGTHKKLRKSGRRHSKSNVFARPRRPSASASDTRHKKTSDRLKSRSFSSSPTSSRTKSSVRKKPTISVHSKSSLKRLGSTRSIASKRTNSQVYIIRNSPVRQGPVRSPVGASPRLSLLYRAPPSPKQGPSVFNSQDRGSCISFMSTSANNSAIYPAAVLPEGDRALDTKRLSADTESVSVANPQQCDRRLSPTKGLRDSDQAISGQPPQTTIVDTFRQRPAAIPYYEPPLSDSQHSMFQIPEIVDKQSQSQIPSLPLTARQSSTLHRVAQPQPAERSDSLENLKLVAAFLDTSAQKKARTPRRPLSGCIPAVRSQSRPQSSSQGSFLVPPPVVIASPCQSETIFPRTSSPPTRSGISNFARGNIADTFPKSAPKDVPINLIKYLQRTPHKPSIIPKPSAPLPITPAEHGKPSSNASQNRFPTTHVSRQLLPALLFPCAIAMPDQGPIFNNFTAGTPVAQPPPILKKIVPATPVKSNTSSIKSSASTLQSIFNPTSEQQVLTASERNAVLPLNTDSALRIEGLGEDERVSLRSSTLIRNTNSAKEVRLRPSRGRNVSPSKSQSKKLVAVSALEPSGCIESRPDVLTTIRETKSEDVCGNSTARFRPARTETETSAVNSSLDWVPAHHKTTTKPPFSSKSLPFSGKTSAAATLRKIAAARYSKHKGFYIRQKPGLEQFQVVLVDTDELGKKKEPPGADQKNESATSMSKFALGGRKDKAKSNSAILGSVTTFATPAAAIVIPQIISTNSLWQAQPPLAIRDVTSQQQTANDRSIHGEPQQARSEFQPILSEPIRSTPPLTLIEPKPVRSEPQTVYSESIRSDLQSIRNEQQPGSNDSKTIHSEPQQVRSELRLTRSESQPTRSEPKPIQSEHRQIYSAQHIPDTTSQRTTEVIQSGGSNKSNRPRPHEAILSASSPPSRSQELRYAISKRDLTPKGTRSTQRVMNRSKKSSYVSMPMVTSPFEFKFQQGSNKYDASNLAGTSSDKAALLHNRAPEAVTTSSNQKVGTVRGSLPCYQYVKLSQSLPQACGSPSLLKLMNPTKRTSKSIGEIRTSLLKVLSRPEPLLSPLKPVSSQLSAHDESRFAAELLAIEPSPATSHMTQVETTDIVGARNSEMKPIDSTLSLHLDLYGSAHGVHKPGKGTLRPNRNLKDESTSYGSLGETHMKSRRVRLATNEIALQVSKIDFQPKVPLKRTNSKTKHQQFTSTRKRPVSTKARSHTNITLQASHQKTYHERPSLKGRTAKQPHDQRPVLLSPPCSPSLGTPNVHCLPEAPNVTLPSRLIPVRKKSGHRVKTNEPRPKTPLHQTSKPNRARIRKPSEPSTPTRPHSNRATSNSTPTSFPKSPSVRSPFAHRSPQRKRQISPTSNVRTSKAPPLSPNSQRPLKSELLCEGTAFVPEPTEPHLQDYDSHHTIFTPNEHRHGTAEYELRGAETPSTNVDVNLDGAVERSPEMSFEKRDNRFPQIGQPSSTLQNMTETSICSTLATDSRKGFFDGALANLAHEVIAISILPFTKPSVPNLIPAVETSSAQMIRDDTSALSEVQSVAKSPKSGRSRSRPCSQAAHNRKSRHRKSSEQFRRSLTPVSHQLNTASDLSAGAESKVHAPEVFLFGVQEPTHSSPNVSQPSQQQSDSLALQTSVRNFKCVNLEIPDKSKSPSFLQDSFTSVHGINSAELKRRKTSRK